VAYHFGRRLVGQKAATLGFLFIALDPFFAAHTQVFHLDGMLASLTTLSLLAFVHFLQTHRAHSLALSGIAMGLSWLTKLPSALIVPAVGVMILVDLVKAGVQWPSIRRRLLWLCLLGLVGSAVYFALWPALWVSPLKWFTKMLNKTTAHVELGHASPLFFRGEIHTEGQLGLSFYPISYVWRSSPVVLVGLIAAFMASLNPGKRSHSILPRRVMVNLPIFVAVYGVGMSLGSHKFDRYLLPVYPPLMLIAAAGWVVLISQIEKKILSKRRKLIGIGLLTVVVAAHGFGLVQTFPYYLSYYNPVLGGHRKAGEVFALGWGEGLDQAAAYLNQKPDAEHLTVATWYSYSFSYFFQGETRTILNRPSLGAEYLDYLLSSDYIIIYINQWQRQIPASLVARMMEREPEHVVHIGPVPYAFIYRQD
jgi:4-amino-4-deoxy-L-arabinose transferase-like glycosyltransferase